jgi:hypothetical protein
MRNQGAASRPPTFTQGERGAPARARAECPRYRSRELIPAKAKAFRAEAQSRREHKENKAVIYFKSLRFCVSARVQLFFHSFTAGVPPTLHPPPALRRGARLPLLCRAPGGSLPLHKATCLRPSAYGSFLPAGESPHVLSASIKCRL